MSNSLSFQMVTAIASCMREGGSKRSYMRANAGSTDEYVFGLTYKNDLCQTAKEFGRFLRKNYRATVLARDIKTDMVTEFLKEKSTTCDEKTIRKLYSHLKKISLCLKHKYGSYGWHMEYVQMPAAMSNGNVKTKVIEDPDYKKLLDEMRKSPRSQAWKSLVLSHDAGLRVEETVNVKMERFIPHGGSWGYGYLKILKGDGSKGNRERICEFQTAEGRDAVAELVKNLQPGQRIVYKMEDGVMLPMKSKSVLRAIDRAMEKLHISDEYKYNKNHALRKNYAQQCYDNILTAGGSREEAVMYVNTMLGHGAKRKDLVSTYVRYQW